MDSVADTPENVRILNEKLGITSRDKLFNSHGIESINEMFESSKKNFEILCRDIAEKKDELSAAEAEADEKFRTFGEIAESSSEDKLAAMESTALAVSNFSETLQSMQQLIGRGNDIIGKLYDAVVNTDILDPDLLNATASIIHSVRESNDNLIQYNVQKMTLEQQYRLAIEGEKLKHRHALEKEYFKFQLRRQEMEFKAKLKQEEAERKPVDVEIHSSDGGSKIWNQNDMAEFIRGNSEQ